MATIRALQIILYSTFILFSYATSSAACENSRVNFYGKNKCSSNFSGFFNLYGQDRKHTQKLINLENSNWILETASTDNPDRPTVHLATLSINKKLSDKGPTQPAKMLIRCRNNTTAILFKFPGYEMSDFREFSEIVYHTGGETDDILELSLNGDKSVLGVWRGFRAIPFVRKLFDKQKLQVLATAKNGTGLEANFNISGIEKKISKLRETCEW